MQIGQGWVLSVRRVQTLVRSRHPGGVESMRAHPPRSKREARENEREEGGRCAQASEAYAFVGSSSDAPDVLKPLLASGHLLLLLRPVIYRVFERGELHLLVLAAPHGCARRLHAGVASTRACRISVG
eukprot:scaffold86720_cov37-Tisochrysis_lutea.AAC.3